MMAFLMTNGGWFPRRRMVNSTTQILLFLKLENIIHLLLVSYRIRTSPSGLAGRWRGLEASGSSPIVHRPARKSTPADPRPPQFSA